MNHTANDPNTLGFLGSVTPSTWKSEMCLGKGVNNRKAYEKGFASDTKNSCGECYKTYETESIPIKHSISCHINGRGDRRSLTDLELKDLEAFVLRSMSQNFNTSRNDTLDSHIRFFKSTVQQIFDNFYASMKDFEQYKARFQEIIEKNKTESVLEMEQFIKDIINDIMYSDTTNQDDDQQTAEITTEYNGEYNKINKDGNISDFTDIITSSPSTYVKDNYNSMNDTSIISSDDPESRAIRNGQKFNNYMLTNTCLKNRTDSHMLSEINIRNSDTTSKLSKVASAENSQILAAKQKEIEIYAKQSGDYLTSDRNIPVKISSAKNNILLERQSSEQDKKEESFVGKICNFICKKLRRSP